MNEMEPCTKAEEIKTIGEKVESLYKTINGNGNGKGMKTDLALVVKSNEEISKSLADLTLKMSGRAEVDNAIEVERRVSQELEKRIAEAKKTEIEAADRKAMRAIRVKDYIIAAVVIINLFLYLRTIS